MSRRKLAIAAGALIVVGGAAAIAAVGHREARMGHRDMMYDMGGLGGYGRGDGRWDGRFGRGQADDDDAQGPRRRGWLGRSMTAEDFDTRTRERFARIDKNSDGVIDSAEVEAAINARAEGRGRVGERIRQRVLGRSDANRDSKVTRQEALDRAKREFERVDLDGDGRITDADLPPAMRGRGVLKGEAGPMGRRGQFGRLIAADANKDGVITLDEALAEAGKRFDLADLNKDGVTDNADREAMRKEMTDYGVRRFMHANGAGKEGRVTREQFFKTAKERFSELDANTDGRIDRQDWRSRRGRETAPRSDQDDRPDRGERGPGTRDRDAPR